MRLLPARRRIKGSYFGVTPIPPLFRRQLRGARSSERKAAASSVECLEHQRHGRSALCAAVSTDSIDRRERPV